MSGGSDRPLLIPVEQDGQPRYRRIGAEPSTVLSVRKNAMLTRRDKDILRAILTLTAAQVNPGVRRIGKLTSPPLSHAQVAKDVDRLIDRGFVLREPRERGEGSSFRLSREAVALMNAATSEHKRMTLPQLTDRLVDSEEESIPLRFKDR